MHKKDGAYWGIAKYLGVGALASIALVWMMSGWWQVHKVGRSYSISVEYGRIKLMVVPGYQYEPKWVVERIEEPPCWCWTYYFAPRSALFLPLWIVFVVASIPTAIVWWLAPRRYVPGHCRSCGYDLTGNVTGRCPECGTPAPKAGAPPSSQALRRR
jgi:hypothetical protein